MHHRSPLLSLALIATGALATAQTTVVIPCDRDNTLYQSNTGALSNATGPLFVGVTSGGLARRALVHFNVAGALPPGSRILSATLSFEVILGLALSQTGTVHRVQQAWGEGTSHAGGGGPGGGGGAGAPSTAGDATWVHAIYPGTLWTNPGGDYDPTPSFSMTLAIGTAASGITNGAAADVQAWLDSPATNFGWLVRNNELLTTTAYRIGSREATSGRPTLTVQYLAPGTGGSWGTGCATPLGTYGFAFAGAPIGGTSIAMQQTHGVANGISAHFFALDLVPAGLPLAPGCTLHLPLGGLIGGPLALLSPTGGASTPFGVPAGFTGYLVACQTVALDNSPLGFVISNAGVICLQ